VARAPFTLALALLLAASSTARASGIDPPFTGTAWSGVTMADPAAVHWNPAMLSELQGFQLQLNAGVVYGRVGYERERRATYQREDGFAFALPIAAEDVDPSKTGVAEAVVGEVITPSGSLFLSYETSPGLTAALGIYPGFAAPIAFPDAGAHRYQVQEAFIGGVTITPAVGWRPLPWIAVGAGLNVIVGTLGLRTVIDLAATDILGDVLGNPPINQPNDFGADAPPGVRELDVLSRPVTIHDATAVGVGFNVGLTVSPDPKWRIGLAYQHAVSLVFEGRFRLDMNHDLFTKDLAYQGLVYPAEVNGDAWIGMSTPSTLRLGASWLAASWLAVHLMAGWVRYSVVDELRITIQSEDLALPDLDVGPVASIAMPRRWNDTGEVELMTAFRVDSSVRLGLRIGYHSPASPDQTVDLTSVDGHRIVAALMGRLSLSSHVALTAQATLHQLIPRVVEASDHDRANGRYDVTIVGGGLALEGDW
jgi:long-chain fatty acid transport protein